MVRYVCTVKWVSKEGVTKFLREGGKFQGIFEMSFPLEPLFVTIQYIPKIEFLIQLMHLFWVFDGEY